MQARLPALLMRRRRCKRRARRQRPWIRVSAPQTLGSGLQTPDGQPPQHRSTLLFQASLALQEQSVTRLIQSIPPQHRPARFASCAFFSPIFLPSCGYPCRVLKRGPLGSSQCLYPSLIGRWRD